MRKKTVTTTALALLVSATLASAGTGKAPKQVEEMREARHPGKDMRAAFALEIVNPWGEEVTWNGTLYRTGGDDVRKRLVFSSPVDIRGVELLVKRVDDGLDRMKVYLPALRRMRNLRSELQGEPFFGTDFNFEDLGFEQLDFQKHRLAGEGSVDGRACTKVESVPEDSWWYGRIVRCIDVKTHLPLRSEYFDRAGQLYKVRTFDEVKTIDGYPTPTTITMRTVPEKTRTQLRLVDVEYDVGLKPQLVRGSFARGADAGPGVE